MSETNGSIAFELNGAPAEVAATHPHLLAALREELDVTSPKDGCSPTGQCGCCTVLLDGKAVVACQVSLEKAAGRTVTTLEGLDPLTRDKYATAFAATGALQCGFCTPGIVVRVHALLEKKGAELTRDDAARHLGAHLCRCTGYVKILDAVEALAADEVPPPVLPTGVGSRGIKYEACSLAIGTRPFIDDLRVPGLLHAALRLTDHARADVVRIDGSAALALPGVEAVLTAADVPGELRVGIIHHDWPVLIPEGGRTSYMGDVLAVVVAADRETARAAVPSSSRSSTGRCGSSPIPSPRSTTPTTPCGASTATCCHAASTGAATSTPSSRPPRTSCGTRSRPSGSSTRSWSRSRRSRCRRPTAR